MFSEGNAAQIVRCDSPLQIVMMVWRTFLLLKIKAVWHASNFKKSTPNGHYYLQRGVTSNEITQENSWERTGGP
jgi:hypothetical protein